MQGPINSPNLSLDERLGSIASMLHGAHTVADIGADHGRLAFFLLQQDPARQVLVSDISADSLQKARNLFAGTPEKQRAVFVVADGLDALDATNSPDAIVIAGMGAKLICRILDRGMEQIGNALVCLQANLDIDLLRVWLAGNGFVFEQERIVQAAGRYYVLLAARKGEEIVYSDRALFLGPLLMNERPPLYLPYLRWRQSVLRHAAQGLAQSQSPEALARLMRTKTLLAWIEDVLEGKA